LTEINNRNEIDGVVRWADEHQLPVMMIGCGSNIVWTDKGFSGVVMVNKLMGFEIFKEEDSTAYVTVGAGEDWDSVVARVVEAGYSGIEELSLIPGTAGATPVQNVGAYGREISEVLTTLTAYDRQEKQLVTMRGSECQFGYRTSRFKTTDKGRFFITAITLQVTKQSPKQPFYKSVETYFKEHNITEYTPQTVRDAVIAIRSSKLPDPKKIANNGSFFQNPVLEEFEANSLIQIYPTIEYWPQEGGRAKFSAAWLIEQAGFKDAHDQATGMATWPQQPLVLINEHAQTTADLLNFKQKIVDAVRAKFGVELAQEPELIGD
jgi:UDP-N-acetylmuramate dehydrogenase